MAKNNPQNSESYRDINRNYIEPLGIYDFNDGSSVTPMLIVAESPSKCGDGWYARKIGGKGTWCLSPEDSIRLSPIEMSSLSDELKADIENEMKRLSRQEVFS
ncbi:hypothetical protein J4477_02470 [Candidatus Pacearchaeota archaeon]|nr:hypothetical protein [Candidatus Pacearchaeota archaeon]